jgi:hypothetical protein
MKLERVFVVIEQRIALFSWKVDRVNIYRYVKLWWVFITMMSIFRSLILLVGFVQVLRKAIFWKFWRQYLQTFTYIFRSLLALLSYRAVQPLAHKYFSAVQTTYNWDFVWSDQPELRTKSQLKSQPKNSRNNL